MKKHSFLNHLFVTAGITVIFGVIYATTQQSYRTAANDPQIQIARDLDLRLRQGKPVQNFFTDTIDITRSLSPFVALYDANGKPLRSSGYLGNKMPSLPAGVFDFTRSHGEYQVTWQPQRGVRIAAEILSSTAFPVSFIISGRSLQEIEAREHDLVTMVFIGWIACIALALLHALFQFYSNNQSKS